MPNQRLYDNQNSCNRVMLEYITPCHEAQEVHELLLVQLSVHKTKQQFKLGKCIVFSYNILCTMYAIGLK